MSDKFAAQSILVCDVKRLGRAKILVAVLGSLLCAGASAADIDLELRIGAYNTDNVARAASSEEDQTVLSAGTTLTVSGESLRSEASLDADFEYRSFLDDAFDDELLPNVRGDLTLKAIPERILWLTEGRYGIVRRNPLDPSNPENREKATFLSTGPLVTIPMGSRSAIRLNSRLNINNYQDSEIDSDGISGGIAFVREFSRNRSFSVNATGQRVEYDTDFGLQDFETYAAFLALESRISRGTLKAELGANEVHADGETFSGTLASLAWDRQLSASSSLGVSVNQRYTDAGSYFGGLDTVFRPGIESDVVPVRNPFESVQFRVSYGYKKGRLSMAANAGFASFDYENVDTFDSSRTNIGFSLDSEFSGGWTASANLRLENRDFETIDRTDTYVITALSIDRRISRTLSLSLEYRYEDRDSDAGGQDYLENRVTFQIRYSPEIGSN